jgi:hypothetical protein
MYSFAHKSLPEYFAACAMWRDVEAVSLAVRRCATQEADSAVDDAVASSISRESPLYCVPVDAYPAVLSFLVDMLSGLPFSVGAQIGGTKEVGVSGGPGVSQPATTSFQDVVLALHAVVRTSARQPDLCVAASNCASVLAQAGVSLAGTKWQGVHIPRAILGDAVLCHAQLQGANLEGCRMERVVATGVDMRGALLTDVVLGQFPKLVGHTGVATSACFSPDSRVLVSGGVDGDICVWDTTTAECTRTILRAHGGLGVTCVDFSPLGTCFASGGEDGMVKLWEAATATCVGILEGKSKGSLAPVTSVAFSFSGLLLAASGDTDGGIRVWNVRTGRELGRLSGHMKTVLCVRFLMAGGDNKLVSGSEDNKLLVWTIEADAVLLSDPVSLAPADTGGSTTGAGTAVAEQLLKAG